MWKCLSLLGQCVRVSSSAYICTSNGWLGSMNIHINLIINNLSNFSKCGLPCRTVPAGQKHPSTQERVPHWEWGLRWTVGHEEEQAGPQGSYTIPLSHCRAAGNEGNNTSIIKRPVQNKWSYRKTRVRCERIVWHTTELLGPPADVDPFMVALFSIGRNGCTETLTVPSWVTAKTHKK